MKQFATLFTVLLISIAVFAQVAKRHQHVRAGNANNSWKTYSDDKHGFAFQYPSNWAESGKPAEVIDQNGVTRSSIVEFKDDKSLSNLTVEYYLAPKGGELYRYALSQHKSSQGLYAKDSKQIVVAGRNAVVANFVSSIDGKGHNMSVPLRTMTVEFLDKVQTGEIKLQFTTTTDKESETETFNKLLKTFEFIN